MSNVKHVTIESFENEVLNSKLPVLVDFWAEWCGPCKAIAPILDEVSVERQDILIVKINVDDNNELSSKFGVRSIPTMILFNGGKQVASKVGSVSKLALNSFLDSNIE